jgi:BAI1-associated protein 3
MQTAMEPLGHELEQWLAKAMSRFVEVSLNQMLRHRDIFPALHPPSLVRLEFLLRCLGVLGSMRAFRQVCPFNKGVRGEIVNYLRKGSIAWSQVQLRESLRGENPLVQFTTNLLADLQTGLTYYHPLFDKWVVALVNLIEREIYLSIPSHCEAPMEFNTLASFTSS